MEITEKVAYLKGLAEGLGLDKETKEGKIIAAMIDILDDIALELEDLGDGLEEVCDGLDVVSEDLEDVEDIIYDELDEDDFDDEDEEDEEEECYATTCPNCEETVFFDEDVLSDGEVICPNCGEKLEFDLVDLEEDEEDGGDEEWSSPWTSPKESESRAPDRRAALPSLREENSPPPKRGGLF